MKKINKKDIVIVILSLIILLFTVIFLFWEKIENVINNWKNSRAEINSNLNLDYSYEFPVDTTISIAQSCDGLTFYGDVGYLTKGALLHEDAKLTYHALPDTLAIIHYGDKLYQHYDKSVVFYNKKARFSPIGFYSLNQKLIKQPDPNSHLGKYLLLTEQGKVEYLKLEPNKYNTIELEDECDFESKYKSYFNPDIKWQRDIPLAIKDILVDYFQTGIGQHYRFVADRRNEEQLVVYGTFSGNNHDDEGYNKEIALILTHRDEPNREKIMVFGLKNKPYILYNEVFFRSKLLMTTIKHENQLPPEALELSKYLSPKNQIIQIKNDDGSHKYLYYDKEFDSMSIKDYHKTEYVECEEC